MNHSELAINVAKIILPPGTVVEEGIATLPLLEGQTENSKIPFDPIFNPALFVKIQKDFEINVIVNGLNCWAEIKDPSSKTLEKRKMSNLLPKDLMGRAICEALVNAAAMSYSESQKLKAQQDAPSLIVLPKGIKL